MPPANPSSTKRRHRVPRGQGLRTRTGCLTCRRRHVKCDEAKPQCWACVKVRQVCTYGPEPHSSPSQTATEDSSKSAGASDSYTDNAALADPVPPDAQNHSPVYAPRTSLWQPSPTMNTPGPVVYAESAISPPTPTVAMHALPRAPASAPPLHFTGSSPGSSALPNIPRSFPNTTIGPSTSVPSGPNEVWATGSVSSSIANIESDTAGWFSLLFKDAVLGNSSLPDIRYDYDGLDIFGNSIAPTPGLGLSSEDAVEAEGRAPQTSNTSLLERLPRLGRDQLFEKQSWHSSEAIELSPQERFLFQHFVRHISKWIDLFDPKRLFSTFLPHLAVHNVGLMNAILALSVRQLSLTSEISSNSPPALGDPVHYYYKTLHYIQQAMQYDTYKTSLELLSTALIVSAYEMLDGTSKDWERHLKGVFWIQRSQVIHGDSKGLRAAVWWAWLCQDVWAAFREKRKPFTFWKPTRTFEELDPHELAARGVYLFAQVVGFCSEEAMEDGRLGMAAWTTRVAEARRLRDMLGEWQRFLTIEFEAMPLRGLLPSESEVEKQVFEPVWIHPPSFAVAIQLYYCSRILLLLYYPGAGGLETHVKRRNSLNKYINIICGIAATLTDYASSVMCSQCLFIAGLPLEEESKRQAVVKMLRDCRTRCGWPAQPLEDELMVAWEKFDSC